MQSLPATPSGANGYINNPGCTFENDNCRSTCLGFIWGGATSIGGVVGSCLPLEGTMVAKVCFGAMAGSGVGILAMIGISAYFDAKYGGCCGIKSREAAPVHTDLSISRAAQQPGRESIVAVQPLPMHNDSKHIDSDQTLTVINQESEHLLPEPPPSYVTVISSQLELQPPPPSYSEIFPAKP
ncbi:hypothetical protein J7438_15295 [Thalassotalea sp. G20_0]|uniref:hypothetical protein n=1 Tax=Thalassotalea sp. G20_0 TaxID=2821093 RepID=UPI001ADA1386|nr:hypothetical protein [Thalassotalea sp. G20_0]MBO9495443.1 hypothetical protein [Thalassotalea sp. G20_0]